MTNDPEGLVVLTEAKTGFEAETIARSLEAQGIRATVADELTSNAFGGVIRPKVMVRRADLDRARGSLRSIKADSVDIDWSELDVGEMDEAPVGRWSTRRKMAVLFVFLLGALGLLLVLATGPDGGAARTLGLVVFFSAAAMALGVMIAPVRTAQEKRRPEQRPPV